MRKYHCAVIGSGPVGAISALKLLRSGHQVTMFDIGAIPNNPKVLPSSFSGKTVLGDTFPYDLSSTHVFNPDLKGHWYTSQGKYGFSTVWGATWRSFQDFQNETWREIEEDLDKTIVDGNYFESPGPRNGYQFDQSELCNCLASNINIKSNSDIRIERPHLLINPRLCVGKGVCQGGCPNHAIWDAGEILEICAGYPSFNYQSGKKIYSYSSKMNQVRLDFEGGYSEVVDKLIIAAGPVASSMILLNSGEDHEYILMDNQICFRLFLSLRKLKQHEKKFGLSTLTFDYSSLGHNVHMQMYPHVELAISRILGSLPHFIKGLAAKTLQSFSSRLVVGLIFYDQNASGKLKIERHHNGISINSQKMYFQKFKWLLINLKLIQLINLAKLLPIPFAVKKGVPGEGYHVGAAQNPSWDVHGLLVSDRNIGVAGSLALHKLEPGPITKSAMMQALKLATKLVE